MFHTVSAQDDSTQFEPYVQEFEGSEISIEMIPVQGGSFLMGSAPDEPGHTGDEGPVHRVEVSSFWMGRFEITWDHYEQFMRSGGTASSDKGTEEAGTDAVARPSKTIIDPSFGMGKGSNPATSMTHSAALSFARWLSLKTGRFYRLPTEAEWEYACRAGTDTAYSFGNDPEDLNDYAWFRQNSDGQYHRVGLKKSNPWGFHDMHGNIAEWTLDRYLPDYYAQFKDEIAINPMAQPDESSTYQSRTVRGGSWNHEAEELRCAARLPSDPGRWKRGEPQIPKSRWWNTNAPFVGFRVVRPLDRPSDNEIERFWQENLDQFSDE